MLFKRAKEIYRQTDVWIRRLRTQSERRKAADPEIMDLIRPSRNVTNLPDSWDTQFIHKEKSWKHRCRKNHQYEFHYQTEDEINYVTGHHTLGYLMYLYGHSKWVKVCHWEIADVQDLINKGILEGHYETHTTHYHRLMTDEEYEIEYNKLKVKDRFELYSKRLLKINYIEWSKEFTNLTHARLANVEVTQ